GRSNRNSRGTAYAGSAPGCLTESASNAGVGRRRAAQPADVFGQDEQPPLCRGPGQGRPPRPNGSPHMTWMHRVFVPVLMISMAAPVQAGIFSRKPKPNPAEHVPALIMQLKTDPDESKRAAAADELRQFDPKAFPEMMTALTDALLKDPATSVRADA